MLNELNVGMKFKCISEEFGEDYWGTWEVSELNPDSIVFKRIEDARSEFLPYEFFDAFKEVWTFA